MKTLKLVLVGLILLCGFGLAYYLFGNYSDGYRAGTVMKLSRKGLLFKTYEGELNLGLVMNNEGTPVSVSNIWPFTVGAGDTAAIQKLDTAMMTGKRAKLHYREKFVKVPWRGDTKYMVYKVEVTP